MLLKVLFYCVANFLAYKDKNVVRKQQQNCIVIVILANLLILF